MASSPNFDLKEKLAFNFKDTATLNSLCRSIVFEIESGSTTLYKIVETLGSYMTDQDVITREKGVGFLSSILSQLSEDYLNESELHFITIFYCDRMKDNYNIIPSVLNGIVAIVNMIHLPQDASSSLLRAIFDNIQCQSQLSAERHNIYRIFEKIINNRLNDLKYMGPDLVYGIISCIDGERDPNNLMLLFNILPHFITKFPLGHLSEEMFEVVACYFPVDFNPSGMDNLKVTRRDLAERLAPCLHATPEFADYCIPLIIDKLNSSLRVAKLDALNLLRDSVRTFKLQKVKPYLAELWTNLKKEIIPGRDVEIRDAALEAIISLIKVTSINETVCKNFIDEIITDTRWSLNDVQLGLYKSTEILLERIAMISKTICVQILQIVIPLFVGQYVTKTLDDKITSIESLNNFIKISSNFGVFIQNVPELAWTNIIEIYLDNLMTKDVKLKSKILVGLMNQKAYLNDIQRSILYNTICNEIDTGCDDRMQTVCHTTILDFATLYLEEILTLVKERLLLNADDMEIELLKRRIKALSRIARIRELGRLIVPKIVTMLIDNSNIDIRTAALMNIQELIVSKKSDFNMYKFLHEECHIIDKLISHEINAIDHHRMLVSSICQLIVRNLSIEEQDKLVMKHLNEKMLKNDMTIIMNLLIPLRKEININISKELIENVCNLAISNDNLDVRQMSCKFLSVLLNKRKEKDDDWIVDYLENKINDNLEMDIDIKLKEYAINLEIWITKGLVMRGCNKAQCSLERLTNLLMHNEIGKYVGEQYEILVSKHEDVLIMENFCNMKILYKQRVFTYLLQQNVYHINSMRQNYLTALIPMLEQIPEQLLFLHIAELVPLLIESLPVGDNKRLTLSALTSLKVLVDTKREIFFDNIQCVIPRIIQLSSTHGSMDIRIAALECLAYYADYPTILINPYKQDVLEKLATIIDDRKRLVRKAAVEARIRWFIIGTSEE